MKQIALIGGARSWVRAPYTDPAWTIWAHSSLYKGIPRADVWFDMHTPDVRQREKSWGENYQEWLRGDGRGGPIYLQDAAPEIPNSLTYPRAEVEAWFRERGATDQPYVTSTVAHMFKLALYQGAPMIGLWGINFDEKSEYIVQRPCVEYWVGFARALGVKVYITPTSPLCRDRHVYGYHGDRPDLKPGTVPFRPQRLTRLHAIGAVPIVEIPPEIQALVDEEKDRWGIDTEAEWKKAASAR